MAIKNVRTATYVADTGKEFNLGDMSASHILNVIAHHQKQYEALTKAEDTNAPASFIIIRKKGLEETIKVLYEELTTRDPDKDDDIAPAKKWTDSDRGY